MYVSHIHEWVCNMFLFHIALIPMNQYNYSLCSYKLIVRQTALFNPVWQLVKKENSEFKSIIHSPVEYTDYISAVR